MHINRQPIMSDKNEQLKTTLRTIGFGEKESDVYMALLELGKGTVSEISRRAGINRTTGYDILASLVTKGVVNASGKEPKQEYSAESPDTIIDFLKKQAALAAEYVKKGEAIVPELKLKHVAENRPKIKFYEGMEGLEHAYEDTLTASGQILAYATVDEMFAGLPHYFPEYCRRRAEKGIFARSITPKTAEGIERASHNKEELREIAFVPKEQFYFSPEINIYDDKIMIASWREKLGIIIESHEIADAMRKIYELAWAEAKRLDADLRLKP